jgi:hypothetical protein
MAIRTHEATSVAPAVFDYFSLMGGGPLHRFARALGLPAGGAGLVTLGIALAILTWTPLFVLTAAAGTLTSGVVIPFSESTGTHVRLLAAIPLFFGAEAVFDLRVRRVVLELASHLVAPRQLPRLNAALQAATQWRDGWFMEAAVALATIVLATKGIRTDAPLDVSTWRHSSGDITAAGWWYIAAVVPVFQFLMLRWAARLVIWTGLLIAFLRLDLELVPTHPDLAGGLGSLGVAQVGLAPLSFALSAVLAGTYAEEVAHGLTPIDRIVTPLVATVILNMLMLTAPLLLFTRRLAETKHRGLLDYGGLASDYTRAFDAKWLRQQPPPAEPLLGSADVQSLADLANAYNVVRSMRIVPIAPHQTFVLGIAAALPAVPLIFFVVPLDELIVRAVKTLLQI